MFIGIQHQIHDASRFQDCAEAAFPPPAGLQVHMFLPSSDLSRAFCLYEAESIDQVRAFVDEALAGASTQTYFPVAESHAVGLPSTPAA